jgi:hypothetical protein
MNGIDGLLFALKAKKIEGQLAELLTTSACVVAWTYDEDEPGEAAHALNAALADAYCAAVRFSEERIERW